MNAPGFPPQPPFLTRIAPTPSGFLHVGNVVSFVVTWLIAKKFGGKILLRIDDLDNQRFRPEYLEDIFHTLDWLGLDYDQGPFSMADFHREFSQHHRLPLYEDYLKQLADRQDLIFACTCSRAQIKAQSANGEYAGECREKGLPLPTPEAAWRIRTPDTAVCFEDWRLGAVRQPLAGAMRDFVVRRKDGLPAYQIASLVDDAYFGVNLIVRGEDLLDSTAAQLYLLSAARPTVADAFAPSFFHHPLLKKSNGEKLSKSAGDRSIAEQRQGQKNSQALWREIAQVLGYEGNTLQDFLEQFDPQSSRLFKASTA